MFSDAITALEKLGGVVRDAAQLPKARRAKYLDAVTEAFSLVQAAVLLVETTLNDLLHIKDDDELTDEQKRRRFVQGLADLGNVQRWLEMEREVSLCRSLRVTSKELDGAFQSLIDRVALGDRNAIHHLISEILERERMLAHHIGRTLQELASMAPQARASPQGRAAAWRAVHRQRQAIAAERHSLIDAERRFLDSL